MNRFAHYQKYSRFYEVGVIAAFLLVNAIVLATTHIFDAQRNGALPFQVWEPFVWEFSSALVICALLPAVHRLYDSKLVDWSKGRATICVLLLASVLFSVMHITGMVIIRKVVYWAYGTVYEFGHIGFEFLYEYRKDLVTFILIVALLAMYRALISRLQSEAKILDNSEDGNTISDRILVTKLGKEFIVKISDIEWLESSGNYVNLHIGNRIYPTRNTMTSLMDSLSTKGFCRTHRSYGVNLDHIESISPQSAGNNEVRLNNGKLVPLSRRYREQLKQSLNLG